LEENYRTQEFSQRKEPPKTRNIKWVLWKNTKTYMFMLIGKSLRSLLL
jgi:hypothetical protein